MFSEKKSTNKRPVAQVVNNMFYRFLRENLSTINLEKPSCNPIDMFGPETFTTNLEATSPLISGFFNPSNIHLFKTEQGSIRLWCKYIWYTYILLYIFVCMNLQCTYIYIHLYIWPLHTHDLVFLSHVSWKTVLVKEDMVRQCRVRKITYP